MSKPILILAAVMALQGCTADATGKNSNASDHPLVRYSIKQPDKPSEPPAPMDLQEMVRITGTQQRESDKPGGAPMMPSPEQQSDDPDPAKPLPIPGDGYYTFEECQNAGANGITIWKSSMIG